MAKRFGMRNAAEEGLLPFAGDSQSARRWRGRRGFNRSSGAGRDA